MIDGDVSGTQPSRPKKHIVNVGLPALQFLRSLMHAHMGLEGCGEWSGCVVDGDVSGTQLLDLRSILLSSGFPRCNSYVHACMHMCGILALKVMIIVSSLYSSGFPRCKIVFVFHF